MPCVLSMVVNVAAWAHITGVAGRAQRVAAVAPGRLLPLSPTLMLEMPLPVVPILLLLLPRTREAGASAANRDHAQVTCTKRAVVQPTTDRVIACASAIADAQADAANRAEVTRVDSASAWTCTRQPLHQGCRRPVSPWCGCLAGCLCHHHHPYTRRRQRGCRRRSRLSRRRQLRPSHRLRLRQWRRRRS
jgi:hypothetical protein